MILSSSSKSEESGVSSRFSAFLSSFCSFCAEFSAGKGEKPSFSTISSGRSAFKSIASPLKAKSSSFFEAAGSVPKSISSGKSGICMSSKSSDFLSGLERFSPKDSSNGTFSCSASVCALSSGADFKSASKSRSSKGISSGSFFSGSSINSLKSGSSSDCKALAFKIESKSGTASFSCAGEPKSVSLFSSPESTADSDSSGAASVFSGRPRTKSSESSASEIPSGRETTAGFSPRWARILTSSPTFRISLANFFS